MAVFEIQADAPVGLCTLFWLTCCKWKSSIRTRLACHVGSLASCNPKVPCRTQLGDFMRLSGGPLCFPTQAFFINRGLCRPGALPEMFLQLLRVAFYH